LVLDPPLAPMVEAHEASGAVATVLLRRVEDVSPFGLVLREDDGSVKAFLEKRPYDETGQRTVNAGVYLLDPEVLDAVPAGQSWSVERQLFPDLLAAGRKMYGHLPFQPFYWLDVGRLDTYRQAHHDLLDGRVSWCGPDVSETARISPEADIRPPVALGEGGEVAEGAVVGPYVAAGAGALIGEGARVEHSVLWPGARVGCGAEARNVILVADAILPDGHSTCDRIVMPSDC
ncbi:MAG: NDP-sugar synthase, partial [Armatimonadetes bacterium]|nr:NDP-sugar synthase [Armatimonadota bacterium]